MKKSILVGLAALALLSLVPGAALAQGNGAGTRNARLMERLRKARAENRRVEVKLKDGTNVLGRVGEVRERGFTFEPANEDSAYDLRGRGLVAAILYEEVSTVQYPSKVRKFFKGVGKGFTIAGMSVAFLPTYAVLALLGELPSC